MNVTVLFDCVIWLSTVRAGPDCRCLALCECVSVCAAVMVPDWSDLRIRLLHCEKAEMCVSRKILHLDLKKQKTASCSGLKMNICEKNFSLFCLGSKLRLLYCIIESSQRKPAASFSQPSAQESQSLNMSEFLKVQRVKNFCSKFQ